MKSLRNVMAKTYSLEEVFMTMYYDVNKLSFSHARVEVRLYSEAVVVLVRCYRGSKVYRLCESMGYSLWPYDQLDAK